MKRREFLSLSAAALACGPRRTPPGRIAARLWYSYGGRNREVLLELLEQFHRAQSEVWIDATFQGDYYEGLAKLRTALAAGAAPALSHVVGEVVPYLHEAGVLEPLGAYAGARELEADLVPELGQAGTWRGGADRPLVALPFNRSTPIAFCNGAMFAERGLRPPTTWAELRQVASEVGFGCPVSWWFWIALVGQGGGAVVEDDGTPSLGGPAGERAVALWQTLVHEDRSMEIPAGRDYNAWEVTNQAFLSGRAGMIWTSTAFLSYLEDNARFPVVAAPLPADRRRAVPTGGTFWIMLRHASAEERAAAWAFLRWLHGAEPAAHWARRTGYLPVTRGAVARLTDGGFFAAHPNFRVAAAQLEVALRWPWSPSLFRLEREVVQPRLEEAVIRRQDPAAAMASARRAARELAP